MSAILFPKLEVYTIKWYNRGGKTFLPIISQFYGIIITMYYKENGRHKLPHLHAEYGGLDTVFDLNGNQLSGNLPPKQKKMVEAWILIHQEELNTLWSLMKQGKGMFKINPLK